jgi:alkylated DNA nucleotide flippase Atl1
MRTRRHLSWREKLADDKDLPKVIAITGKLSRRWGTGTCAIPAPREVDALIRQVRRGKVTTINELRTAVARQHRATIGCPITTGIFAWIAAHAAAEDEAEGRKRVTPWWRVLKEGGKLNPKFPGGIAEQARRLRGEGHELLPAKGKQPPRVADWEHNLSMSSADRTVARRGPGASSTKSSL